MCLTLPPARRGPTADSSRCVRHTKRQSEIRVWLASAEREWIQAIPRQSRTPASFISQLSYGNSGRFKNFADQMQASTLFLLTLRNWTSTSIFRFQHPLRINVASSLFFGIIFFSHGQVRFSYRHNNNRLFLLSRSFSSYLIFGWIAGWPLANTPCGWIKSSGSVWRGWNRTDNARLLLCLPPYPGYRSKQLMQLLMTGPEVATSQPVIHKCSTSPEIFNENQR